MCRSGQLFNGSPVARRRQPAYWSITSTPRRVSIQEVQTHVNIQRLFVSMWRSISGSEEEASPSYLSKVLSDEGGHVIIAPRDGEELPRCMTKGAALREYAESFAGIHIDNLLQSVTRDHRRLEFIYLDPSERAVASYTKAQSIMVNEARGQPTALRSSTPA